MGTGTESAAGGGLTIGEAERRQYREEGYFVLEGVLPQAEIAMLRQECARAMAIVERAMDEDGVDTIGLNHRGQRYIVPLQYKKSDRLPSFLFSPTMAEICRATLGEEAYLFLEQFVVKGAQVGMELGWHQDAGYLPFDPPAYYTVWITLDDVDEDNGTIYVLPYGRAGTRGRVEHHLQAGSNDKVGYFGPDPGVPVVAPAGSLAILSSTTFHRSGPNRTAHARRAYLAQYSERPIMRPDGAGPRHFADPFLAGGEILPQPSVTELRRAPDMPWTWSE